MGIEQMQEEINRLREQHSLLPVTEFVTIKFRNGTIVMAADEFVKPPKRKQKKLMEW